MLEKRFIKIKSNFKKLPNIASSLPKLRPFSQIALLAVVDEMLIKSANNEKL